MEKENIKNIFTNEKNERLIFLFGLNFNKGLIFLIATIEKNENEDKESE